MTNRPSAAKINGTKKHLKNKKVSAIIISGVKPDIVFSEKTKETIKTFVADIFENVKDNFPNKDHVLSPSKYRRVVRNATDIINKYHPTFSNEFVKMKMKYKHKLSLNDYHGCLTLGGILHDEKYDLENISSLAYGVNYVRPEKGTSSHSHSHKKIRNALLHTFLYRFYQLIITTEGITKFNYGTIDSHYMIHLNRAIMTGIAIIRHMDLHASLMRDIQSAVYYMMDILHCNSEIQKHMNIVAEYFSDRIAPIKVYCKIDSIAKHGTIDMNKLTEIHTS